MMVIFTKVFGQMLLVNIKTLKWHIYIVIIHIPYDRKCYVQFWEKMIQKKGFVSKSTVQSKLQLETDFILPLLII